MRTRTSRILSASFAPALIALVGALALGGTAVALEPQDVPATAKPAAVEKHQKTGKAHHHRHHAGHKHHEPATTP